MSLLTEFCIFFVCEAFKKASQVNNTVTSKSILILMVNMDTLIHPFFSFLRLILLTDYFVAEEYGKYWFSSLIW